MRHGSTGLFADLGQFVDQRPKNSPFGGQSFQGKRFSTSERFREGARAAVSVSQDLAAVLGFCDRMLLLRRGKLEMGKQNEVERYIDPERVP